MSDIRKELFEILEPTVRASIDAGFYLGETENVIKEVTNQKVDEIINLLPKWIPCSERLPEINTPVLIFYRSKSNILSFHVAFYVDELEKWVLQDDIPTSLKGITHWISLEDLLKVSK